jgi:hypothetical protein
MNGEIGLRNFCLGIHKWDFRCSVSSVELLYSPRSSKPVDIYKKIETVVIVCSIAS